MPEVSGGMIFVGSCNSVFHVLDAVTGVPVWRYDISRDGMQRSFHGRMLFTDDLVIIGTDIPTGHVYAFDRYDGTVRWKRFTGPGVRGDIVGAGSLVYALTKEDTLLCLAPRTGDLVWSFHPGETAGDDNGTSPCLSDGRVFMRDGGRCVYALAAASGGLLWKRALPDDPVTSLLVLEAGIYVGTQDGTLYRLAVETGETEAALKLDVKPYGVITYDGHGLIFFAGRAGQGSDLFSVAADLGGVRWRREAPKGSAWTTYRPDFRRGGVIVGEGGGGVGAYRSTDGKLLWLFMSGGTIKTITHVGDTLFVGNYEGVLRAYELEEVGGK